jgi:hypothetical protein
LPESLGRAVERGHLTENDLVVGDTVISKGLGARNAKDKS